MKIEIKSGLSTTTLETNDHVVVHAGNSVYNFFYRDGELITSKVEKIIEEEDDLLDELWRGDPKIFHKYIKSLRHKSRISKNKK